MQKPCEEQKQQKYKPHHSTERPTVITGTNHPYFLWEYLIASKAVPLTPLLISLLAASI